MRTLTDAEFTTRAYSSGEEGIVLTTQVPSGQVWRVPVGEPLTLALVSRQTFTVDEGTANQQIDLTPNAPIVDYLDDPQAGEYTENAYILGYFDSDADGTPDTQITGASAVQYSGTFTEDGDFVDSFEVDETSGNAGTKDVEFYVVQRYGLAELVKRNSGAGNVSQKLQGADQITWAFASPYDPAADRQITWQTMTGARRVLPPKFNLDVVFFAEQNDVNVDLSRANNLAVSIPMEQRPVKSDEDPKALRREITQQMTEV
jgi:hypothetical protein